MWRIALETLEAVSDALWRGVGEEVVMSQSLEKRVDRLEGRVNLEVRPLYLAFDWGEEAEAWEAAERCRCKVYIGVSPDDWPSAEEVSDAGS